jgi:hypothetical protein
VHFADGGSVNASVTFSDFGCAGTIAFPDQAPTTSTVPASCPTPVSGSSTTTGIAPTTADVGGAVSHVEGSFVGTEHFAPTTGSCADLDHHLDSTFSFKDGTTWKFRADYCGAVDGNVWRGDGTFTFTIPSGAQMTGYFKDVATIPSPGVPYTLVITNGTGRFLGASGSCDLDNHLRPIASGEQEQHGTFTCDIET